MKLLSDDTLNLLELGIVKKIYFNKDLEHAVHVIFNDDPDRLIRIYLYIKSTLSFNSMNFSDIMQNKNICLTILKQIIFKPEIFKKLLEDLPSPDNMDIDEFELIINYTFNFAKNEKEKLIKFICNNGGETKIKFSNLSEKVKEELNSYFLINKLIPK